MTLFLEIWLMILYAEISMLVLGLIGLVGGFYPATRGVTVRGIHARFLGLISLLPIPVAIGVSFAVFFISAVMGTPIPKEMVYPVGVIIEITVVLSFFALVTYLGYRWNDPSRLATPEATLADTGDQPTTKPPHNGPFDLTDDGFQIDVPAAKTSSGMARASLMLGIFSLLTSILASIPAFILGGLALSRIERSGGRIAGKGVAVAGIVLGIIGTFTGFIALALLLPFLKTVADPGPAPLPPIAAAPARIVQPAAVPNPEPVVAKADPRPNVAPARPRPPRAKGGFNRPDNPIPKLEVESKPQATGISLANKSTKLGDLKVTEIKVAAAKVPRCLFWGDDGKVVFVLETDGTLRRILVEGFVEELKWEVGHKCSWLSVSSEGLVLTVDELQEVWLLEPKTFAIKNRTAAASVTRADSSPAIAHAFATGKQGDSLAVIDLKAGSIVHEYDSRSFPDHNVGYARLAVSPDGKSVFAEGMERLIRFEFNGDELSFAEQSERIAANGQAIEISADGAYVALPSAGAITAHRLTRLMSIERQTWVRPKSG